MKSLDDGGSFAILTGWNISEKRWLETLLITSASFFLSPPRWDPYSRVFSVVPSVDAHGSEYAAACDQRMEWISGQVSPPRPLHTSGVDLLLASGSLVPLVRRSSRRLQHTSSPTRDTGHRLQTRSTQIGTLSKPDAEMARKTGLNGSSKMPRTLVSVSTPACFVAPKPPNSTTSSIQRARGSSTPVRT